MRLAVLADVHGNLPALEAVLRDLRPYQPDGIVVAGDFIAGPQPNEVIRLLRSMNGWMIRGNSDEYVLQLATGKAAPGWYTSKQWALSRWTWRHLEAENLQFLGSLPNQRVIENKNIPPIRVVHGTHRKPSEAIFPERNPDILGTIMAEVNEPVFICGHTHIAWKHELPGRLFLNPGAVCGPLDGFAGAEYALLSWENGCWQAELRKVPYDLEQIKKAFYDSGLLREGGALAHAFLCSIETGQNIAEDFLSHAYTIAEENGHGDCEIIPDPIWERADKTFKW